MQIDLVASSGLLDPSRREADLAVMPMLRRVLPDTVDINRAFWLVIPRVLRGIVRIERFVDWLVKEGQLLRPSMMGTARL